MGGGGDGGNWGRPMRHWKTVCRPSAVLQVLHSPVPSLPHQFLLSSPVSSHCPPFAHQPFAVPYMPVFRLLAAQVPLSSAPVRQSTAPQAQGRSSQWSPSPRVLWPRWHPSFPVGGLWGPELGLSKRSSPVSQESTSAGWAGGERRWILKPPCLTK